MSDARNRNVPKWFGFFGGRFGCKKKSGRLNEMCPD
jgi:hypothetical protein